MHYRFNLTLKWFYPWKPIETNAAASAETLLFVLLKKIRNKQISKDYGIQGEKCEPEKIHIEEEIMFLCSFTNRFRVCLK